ncbi:MAG TPA: sensor domain-containing protein [Acidimicrobiales bacterium]|jgi:hypothetical protein|nr:sensor domain-containing protein [Acidimicrobiales bacterium]
MTTIARTQRRIAYLLLGFPLGTAWFALFVTAVSVSLSMVVVALIGIPMLWATWLAVRACANVERFAANTLLDRDVPLAPMTTGTGNVWARLRAMSGDRRRWAELRYLFLRFPAGIATFTAALTALTVPVMVAVAPIQARIDDHPFGDWALSGRMEDVAASPWAWLLVPLGAVLLVAAVYLLNRLADACGRWTVRALG